MTSFEVADALMLPLMFHSGRPWTAADLEEWKRITGTDQVTTKAMCDHIRLVQALVKYPLDADLERERQR
jgi:hypothetical protein